LRGVVCDIDGVILRDETALPGAKEFIEWLVRGSHEFLFLTNYASQTQDELRARFARAGLEVSAERFYTAAMATAEFLNGQAGEDRRAFVVGDKALVDALKAVGFTEGESGVPFVILGETQAYNMEMIRKASALISAGARFVATNPDIVGPLGRPACGALAAPIERITGRKPFYVGKPSAFMMRAALRHLKIHSEEACMVGDNMDTDILAGIQSGMETVLVLSGVSRREDLPKYAYRPRHIVEGVLAVRDLFEGSQSKS
jgi:NagD protein